MQPVRESGRRAEMQPLQADSVLRCNLPKKTLEVSFCTSQNRVQGECSRQLCKRSAVPSSSDPENPCPICFENEDNADAKDALAGMCYNCGHFFCGECNMYGKCAALQVIFSLLLFLLLVSFFFFIHTVPVDPSLLTPRAVDVHICVCVCVCARVQPYRTDAYILSSSN